MKRSYLVLLLSLVQFQRPTVWYKGKLHHNNLIPDRVVTVVHDDGTFETRPAVSLMTFANLLSHSSGLNAGLVGKIRPIEMRRAESITKAA